ELVPDLGRGLRQVLAAFETQHTTGLPLQRLQFNVAEIDFGAFGLKEYLALGLLRLAAFVLRLAVDDQVDRVALAGNVVLIPFADRLFHAVFQMKIMTLVLRVLSCRIDGKLEAV